MAVHQPHRTGHNIVSLERYLNFTEINILQKEIKITNALNLFISPQWINLKRAEEHFNNNEITYLTIIIKVRSKIIADSLIAKDIKCKGKKYFVKFFHEIKADIICQKCFKFSHNSYNACKEELKCNFCGKDHETKDHKCSLKGCTALSEIICAHTSVKYINYNDSYFSNSSYYSKRLKILEKMRKEKKEEFQKLQQSHKRITVVILSISSIFVQENKDNKEKEIKMHSSSTQLC